MIALTLCIALAHLPGLQGDPESHARLHPGLSDFYAEVPDFAGTLEAYKTIALVQLVEDPDFLRAVRDLGGDLEPEDFDLESSLRDWLEAAVAEEPMLGDVLQAIEGVASFSVSIGGGRSLTEEEWRASFAPLQETHSELRSLAKSLQEHEHEHGEFPASLGELDGFQAKWAQDAWNHDYVYERLEGGFEYELYSHGSDGEPGGEFLARELHAGTALFDHGGAYLLLRRARLQLVVEFETAAYVRLMGDWMQALLTEEGSEIPGIAVAIEGADGEWEPAGGTQPEGARRLTSWTFDDLPEVRAWSLEDGKRWVFGLGDVSHEEYDLRRERELSGLDTELGWRGGRSQLGARRGVVVWQGFNAMDSAWMARMLKRIELLEPDGEPQEGTSYTTQTEVGDLTAGFRALWRLFMGSGGATTWRTQLDAGRFVIENVTQAGQHAPLFGIGPVTTAARELIPADAVGAVATTVDGAELYDFWKELVQIEGELDLDAFEERFTTETGFLLDRDVFGNVGPAVVGFFPAITGPTPPKFQAWLDLREPERFAEAFHGLARWMGQEFSERFAVELKDYRGVTIVSIEDPKGRLDGPGLPTSLSLAVFNERLYISLGSTVIKGYVRAQAKGEELASGPHPMFQSQFRPPEGATRVSYLDFGAVLARYYQTFKTFGAPMMMGMLGSELDADDLPDPDLFRRHFPPSVSYSTRTSAGTYTWKESAYGPEWVGVPFLFGAAAFGTFPEIMGAF